MRKLLLLLGIYLLAAGCSKSDPAIDGEGPPEAYYESSVWIYVEDGDGNDLLDVSGTPRLQSAPVIEYKGRRYMPGRGSEPISRMNIGMPSIGYRLSIRETTSGRNVMIFGDFILTDNDTMGESFLLILDGTGYEISFEWEVRDGESTGRLLCNGETLNDNGRLGTIIVN